MMTNLSWSALILAALVAVACWNPEEPLACDADRPVYGSKTCCERHETPRPSRGALRGDRSVTQGKHQPRRPAVIGG